MPLLKVGTGKERAAGWGKKTISTHRKRYVEFKPLLV